MPMPSRFPFRIPFGLPLWSAFLVFSVVMTMAVGAQPAKNPLQLRPHHATAAVADIERAVRWYQDVLGFELINRRQRPDGGLSAELEIPGYGVALVQYPGPARPAAARSGWVHTVFAVPDVPRAYATLKARGGDVSTRGNAAAAEITSFILHDSEGNEIEIVGGR
jgi:catechol 2,3-dioxygenase-like lactoylglutathione lyase family enzyme